MLAVVVLAACVALAGALARDLLVGAGVRDLDAVLGREQQRFAAGMAELLSSSTGGAGEPAVLVRAAAVEYLARHPSAPPYLLVVRIGDEVLSSPGGPAELAALRDRGELPRSAPGLVQTVQAGELPLRSLTATVSTGGALVATVQIVGSVRPVQLDALQEVGRLVPAGLLALATGGLLLAAVVHRTLRPLRSLSVTARAIELSDLAVRVPEPGGRDEVSALAAELNRMLGRLESANRARGELFAAASHELRTPLTIARGQVETLAAVARDDPSEVAATTRTVAAELLRMTRLLDDLMLLARAEGPGFVAPTAVDLGEFLADLRLRVNGLRLNGVRMADASGITVRADPERLAQAVLNLLVNATTHNPPGTTVRVDVSPVGDAGTGGAVELAVRDDGPGLADAVRDRAFEPFVRASTPATSSAGLGLAVVRAVALAHGHPPRLTTGPNGTAVTLRLDRAPVPRRTNGTVVA